MNSTLDLFEAEAVKAIVANLLEENPLGPQQHRILKFLAESPNSYTHEIRQACSTLNQLYQIEPRKGYYLWAKRNLGGAFLGAYILF